MNILYIIGNGFDLNLGMNTRYSDFYKYYQTIESKSIIINKLKKEILNNYKTWSDLELELGNFTESINNIEEFDELFEDIVEKLALYLEEEENKFDFSKIEREKMDMSLAFPEKHLMKADELELVTYKNTWKINPWKIDIITLNYTKTIEKIFEFESGNVEIGLHHNERIYLHGVEHIHGFTNNRMILGVNDLSQIKNKSLHENQDILNAVIKSNCNKVSKHTIDKLCMKQILSANLICIFGSSIGETDNVWWELIGEQLKNNIKLIIFEKGENISPIFEYKKDRRIQKIKDVFLKKTKLTEEEKNKYRDNIYVGVNTEMFKSKK